MTQALARKLPDPRRKPARYLAPYLVMGAFAVTFIALPAFGLHRSTLSLLSLAVIFGIAVMSLDYIYGYGGMMSFGHAALFGFGAYIAGFSLQLVSRELFVGLPIAVASTALLAAAWGILLGRLEGVAFAMGTLALASSLRILIIQWRDVTGGTDGLVALPLVEVFGQGLKPTAVYYLSVVIACLTFLVLRYIVRTRYGLALQAVRDNPMRAEAAGIHVYAHRVGAMSISGGIAGMAGALFVYLQGSVDPSALGWQQSGHFMIQLLMGGPGTVVGPMIAAIAMTFLQHWLSAVTTHWELILGTAVVLFVYFTPRGILPGIMDWISRYRRRKGA